MVDAVDKVLMKMVSGKRFSETVLPIASSSARNG
jgi:hypothetical protein